MIYSNIPIKLTKWTKWREKLIILAAPSDPWYPSEMFPGFHLLMKKEAASGLMKYDWAIRCLIV